MKCVDEFGNAVCEPVANGYCEDDGYLPLVDMDENGVSESSCNSATVYYVQCIADGAANYTCRPSAHGCNVSEWMNPLTPMPGLESDVCEDLYVYLIFLFLLLLFLLLIFFQRLISIT